jgi:hypothetical protein
MKKIFVLPAILIMTIGSMAQKWTKEYVYVNELSCGLSLVEKDSKHGYVNKDGKVIIPLIYDDGMNFVEGKAGIMMGNKWGFIDSAGNEIVKPLYSEVYSYNEGMAVVVKGDKWGFIDEKGDLVIPMNYSNARCFSNGLAPVCDAKMQWGFIDKAGKTVLAFQYGYADRFREGTAKVMKAGKWMFIDVTGKVVKEGEEN